MTRGGKERATDRDEVLLERLEEDPGRFVSGSELAELLGVSRAAVGKRIASLRKRGRSIEAVPNRGYRLTAVADSLTPQEVTPLLTTSWLGRLYLHHDALDSTNDEARRMAGDGAPHGTVVTADSQTSGRGRLGRAWHSPAGVNLYASAILRPRISPGAAPPLGLAAAVGVAEASRGFVGRPPTVKWPNDLLFQQRKFCGVLVELKGSPDQIEHVIMGLGINVNSAEFPPDLAGGATSLMLERGERVRRAAVLAATLNSLEPWIDRLVARGPAPVLEAWLTYAPWMGQEVTVTGTGGPRKGIAAGLDSSGALRLRGADGHEELVISGDVAFGDK